MKTFKLFILVLISSLTYAQDKNISVVSVEKANIVYWGIANYIKVAVPGATSFEVTAPGRLEKIDSLGNYKWYLSGAKCCEATLEITAFMENGTTLKEHKLYYITGMGSAHTTIDGRFYDEYGCILNLTKERLKSAKIGYKYENYVYEIKDIDGHFGGIQNGKVNGFTLMIVEGDNINEIEVIGDTMNEAAKKEIDKLKRGDLVYIARVLANGFDRSPRDLSIVITD